ncbi:hypothetical protein D3C80_1269850 [compost metagenome]
MEDFSTCTQSFFEAWSAYWQNHELLNVDVVVSVLTTVDDVHHWYWQCFSVESAQVNIQRNIQSCCSCAGYCHGYSQDCVGAQLAFVRSSVQSDHQLVDAHLVKSVHTDYFWSDKFVYVLNSLQNAFAQVTGFVTIAKLYSFMSASGSAGRNDSAAFSAGFQVNVNLYSRVTAGVKDFACVYIRNNCHVS